MATWRYFSVEVNRETADGPVRETCEIRAKSLRAAEQYVRNPKNPTWFIPETLKEVR